MLEQHEHRALTTYTMGILQRRERRRTPTATTFFRCFQRFATRTSPETNNRGHSFIECVCSMCAFASCQRTSRKCIAYCVCLCSSFVVILAIQHMHSSENKVEKLSDMPTTMAMHAEHCVCAHAKVKSFDTLDTQFCHNVHAGCALNAAAVTTMMGLLSIAQRRLHTCSLYSTISVSLPSLA